MNRWKLQDAKARLSELVDSAVAGTPQLIMRRGIDVVVVLRATDYEALTRPRVSLLDFLASSPHPEVPIEVERSREPSGDIVL